jgi:hypothetical protein
MDIIIDSVSKLEEILRHSGCEEGGVKLDVNPDTKPCQFERGACMVATFGGRSAEFVTFDPIRAMTKISFLTGAPLDTPTTRGAACAIINVVLGFFCLSRVCHACPASAHHACLHEVKEKLAGCTIYCTGAIPVVEHALRQHIVKDPEDAEVVLVNSEGLITHETGGLLSSCGDKKRVICLGPSTAGVARLQQWEHWCPYGT